MTLEQYLEKHRKKHLIFDFDETLFTLLLPWEIYLEELHNKIMDFDPNLRGFSHGKVLNAVENEAVRRWGEPMVKLRREYSEYFEKKFYKGVVEHKNITDFLKKKWKKYDCYIWTSNMRSTIEPILVEHDMLKFFKKLVTRSEVELTKPEPEGFYMIFDEKHHKKEDFLMIGDSLNDEGAAKNAGIDFFLVKEKKTLW